MNYKSSSSSSISNGTTTTIATPLFEDFISDDSILSRVFNFLEYEELFNIFLVNKRWMKVAMKGPHHIPLHQNISRLFRSKEQIKPYSMEHTKLYYYILLSRKNLIKDPLFLKKNPQHPIDPFVECAWLVTKNDFQVQSFTEQMIRSYLEKEGIKYASLNYKNLEENDLVKMQGIEVIGRLQNQQNGENESIKYAEYTQSLELVEALNSNKIETELAHKILDLCPDLSFQITTWRTEQVAMDIVIAMDDGSKVLPYYNNERGSAYEEDMPFMQRFKLRDSDTSSKSRMLRTWKYIIKGYPQGIRRCIISLRFENEFRGGYVFYPELRIMTVEN